MRTVCPTYLRTRRLLLDSMAECVESELEVMKPLRKPSHQEQEQAEHYRSHSETGQRYRQMIPIELFKFIFIHVISLISNRNRIPRRLRARPIGPEYPPVPCSTSQFV